MLKESVGEATLFLLTVYIIQLKNDEIKSPAPLGAFFIIKHNGDYENGKRI